MNRIQSKDGNIGSYRINKAFLCSYDDKKYILKNGYSRITHLINLLVSHMKTNFVKYR